VNLKVRGKKGGQEAGRIAEGGRVGPGVESREQSMQLGGVKGQRRGGKWKQALVVASRRLARAKRRRGLTGAAGWHEQEKE